MATVDYAAGFLKARIVSIDESSGDEELVQGRHVRIRCSRIVGYASGMAGTVDLDVEGYESSVPIWGTVEDVDAVLVRDRIYEKIE